MKSSEEIIEISKALNKMQSELNTVAKDSKGYNYMYADYASIWNALREPLTKNGLAVIQDATTSQEGVSVITRVMHNSGQWIEFGPLLVPMGKKDAHSTGSAISYARRYGLSAALGIVPDDDDGKQAQQNPPKQNGNDNNGSDRKISDAEYELLEMYLENNPILRSKILSVIEERYKVKELQNMPYPAYKQALQSAKTQYQEIADNNEEQEAK